MSLVIFDLDGVIHLGPVLLPHVEATLARLHRAGWTVCFATNGTTLTRDEYAARLRSFGLAVETAQLVSGGSVTAAYLARRAQPPRDILVVGTDGLRHELRAAGLPVRDRQISALERTAHGWIEKGSTPSWTPPDTVVVGLDPDFDYPILAEAQSAVLAGAEFLAANRDRMFPSRGRVWPGAGPIVAAIELASATDAVCIGKPEPHLFQEAARVTGHEAGRVVVVGDSLDSDVVAAHRAGAVAVLVLTGLTAESDVGSARGEAVPDRVIRGLDELFTLPEFAAI